jgi:hypothetical protein
MDIDSFQVAEFATAIESYLYARDHRGSLDLKIESTYLIMR